jgi:hypothetical protein
VETSLLTSVSIVPATVSLNGSLGRVVEAGLLSAPQVESVVCAVEAHAWRLASGARAGFVLGDGAGVGKGRQLAAIVLDNVARGRDRNIWFSTSADLRVDAMRDLRDLGCHVPVHDGCQGLDKGNKGLGLGKEMQARRGC